MNADDNLRDLFNEVAPPPDPSSEQRERARAKLQAEFRRTRRPAPGWWQRPAAAIAGAAVVAAVLVGVLFLPGSSPPVDANLANIAAATRTVSAQELPAGAYVYARTDSATLAYDPPPFGPGVNYLFVETIEVWVQGDSVLETRSVREPRFFRAADEEEYYAFGQDEIDGVGESVTTALTGIQNLFRIDRLATDPDRLRDELFEELRMDPEWSPADESRTLEFIAQLMDPRLNAPPGLRAALIELVGTLDVATAMGPDGRVTVALEHEDSEIGTVRDELVFDSAGYLLVVREIVLTPAPGVDAPAGVWTELTFSRPAIVASSGVPPSG